MATIFLDTGARSFSSKASMPSIQTIRRPFSSGCARLNRMRVGGSAGNVTEAAPPATATSVGEGSTSAVAVPPRAVWSAAPPEPPP